MGKRTSSNLIKKYKKTKKSTVKQTFFFYIFLTLTAITMILPFLWMTSTSLKDPAGIFVYPPKWIPDYHYIIQDEKKIDVNVIEEKFNVKILEGKFKNDIKTVYKSSLSTRWKHLWQPWIKEHKTKIDNRWLKVKLLDSIVKIEIIKEVNGEYKWEERYLSLDQVYRGIKPIWSNYTEVMRAVPFVRFYLNSLFVSVCITIGQVATSAMAAYAFSRLTFPGRDKLFIAYIATMMVPYAVILVPIFILMNWFNWIDTYKALIIPVMFSAYGTFLLRQFFMTIPVDLEDAARIDGCNYFRIFWHIILPLSKPALAALTVFAFMWSWVNLMGPLIFTNSVHMKTLPVGLAYFQETGFGTQYHLLMAGAVMAIIPIIIVFVFNQRFFVEGIKMQGIKG